jgi:hypothetical protein
MLLASVCLFYSGISLTLAKYGTTVDGAVCGCVFCEAGCPRIRPRRRGRWVWYSLREFEFPTKITGRATVFFLSDFYGYGHTKAEQTGPVLWSRGMAPFILNLATRLGELKTSHPGRFSNRKQRPYQPNRRLRRPYRLSVRLEEEKNLPGF